MKRDAGIALAKMKLASVVAKTLEGAARAGKSSFSLAGDVSEGIAKGLGHTGGAASRAVGQAGLLGGVAYGGTKAKQKKDQWMYNHGFYPGS